MSAPLAASYREGPLWHDGVVPEDPPGPSPGHGVPRAADVVVVGAGYCGATAAAGLARRGLHVVVLEAGDEGSGASTRNGGMVIPELKHGPAELVRRHGDAGRAMLRATLAAYAYVRDLVTTYAIDCDWRESGGLLLGHHPHQARALQQSEREWAAIGQPVRFLTGTELRSEIGSDAFVAGLLLEQTAAVQPAKLHAALVARARAAGAGVHHHTRATRLEPRVRGFLVHTARGAVAAGDVLVAANAYVDGVLPSLRERVLPVGSFIIATEPLGPDLARAVMPGDRMCFDTKHLLNYWRLSPDRRMVFGGRASLAATTVAGARDVLYEQMVRIHPLLRETAVTHAWGGSVAVTRDRLPHTGRIDGVAYATGCNGTGIALASWLGERAAAWMTGEEPPPAFSVPQFPAIPLRAWRRVWLPPAGRVLQLADRLGR